MADPDPRPAGRPVGRLAARLRAWPREPRRPISRNDVLSKSGRLFPPIFTAGVLLVTGGFPLLDPRLAFGVRDALMLLGGVLVTALLVLYVRRPVDPDAGASRAEPAAGTRARRVAGLRELGYLCMAEAYFAVSAVVRTGAGRVSSIALLAVGAFAAVGVVVNDIRPRPKRRRSREREAVAGGGAGSGVDLVKATEDEWSRGWRGRSG